MPPESEREFLIRLAPIWLACRWRIMGGRLMRDWAKVANPAGQMAFDFLGMKDYGIEMRLLCAEIKSKH